MRIVRSAEASEAPETAFEYYLRARKERDEAQEQFEKAERAMTGYLEATGRKTYQWDDGRVIHRSTFTRRSTTAIDAEGLRKELGAAGWKKVSVTVLDRKALEAEVEAGTFAPEQVGKFITVTEGKPSIRYTVVERKEENQIA